MTSLPLGHFGAISAIVRRCRELEPSVVHAHSTFAGLYLAAAERLVRLPSTTTFAYTPHGFAFERADVSKLYRWGAELAERMRARVSKSRVIAVGPAEAEIARRCGSTEVAVVRHAPQVNERWQPARNPIPLRVCLVGRVCAQKDPDYLIEMLRLLGPSRGSIAVEWIGDGDPEMVRRLRSAGVVVSGWQDRQWVLSRVAQSDIFLHVAAWEGEPVVVVEAVLIGVPVLARAIPALDGLGPGLHTFGSPQEGVTVLRQMVSGGYKELVALADGMGSIASTFTPEAQKAALLAAWGYDRQH